MKSEILVEKYLKNIDELLFGKKEEIKKQFERIVIDENELPFLYPKTPLPRFKKVSLTELMDALNHAINTENRRIKKEVLKKRAEFQTDIVLPKMGINIKDRIRAFYARFLTAFQKNNNKIAYSDLTGNSREEKLACFLPMLHLTNQQRLYLEQEKHFSEIYIWLYTHYKKLNPIDKEMAELAEELAESEKLAKVEEAAGFENPLGNIFDNMDDLAENKSL
jgi:chromatin segregation and condensation protein Rec8/ScpA/Scc1 (kleisin family)